jgi:predicted transcriptional regulator
MDAKELEESNKQFLSRLFSAVSTETRLSALQLFNEDKDLAEIAKLTGMSRSGFQKVVEAFRELGLIEYAGHRSRYRLSAMGKNILALLNDLGDKLEPIRSQYEKSRLTRIMIESPLTTEDLEKLVRSVKKTKQP